MSKAKVFPAAIFIALSICGCSEETPFAKDMLLMDTLVRVEARGALSRVMKARAVAKSASRMKELERRFDRFTNESELARINRLKKGEGLPLSEEMFKVLARSRDLCRKTGGAFDVAMGMDGWVLDERERSVCFKKEGIKLDLGGIAMGFIVDEGVRVLKEMGVENGLVTAGGDMYCMGEEFRLGIRDPKDPRRIIATFGVQDKGVATSGGYERPFHIIDPRTASPVEEISRGATVVADDCMTADSLATAVYVLGPEAGLSAIEENDAAECVIIDEDGRMYISSNFPQITLTKAKR